MRLAVTFAAVALAGCASSPGGSMPIRGDAYYTMPLEALAGRVSVTDDPLDGYRLASASGVRAQYVDLFGIDSDVYFRAFAWDSGDHAVQVYFRTEASDWLFPTALNFGSPVRSVRVTSVNSDVSCRSGRCEHFESVIAKLSPADVQAMLAPETPDVFEVRLKTQSGINVDRTLRKDELRAVLGAAGLADRY
jgi:hypothetical protein